MAKGVQIAQEGMDVKFAADYNMELDTRWPVVQVAGSGSYSVDAQVYKPIKVFDHNLGFVPPFIMTVDGRSENTPGGTNTHVETTANVTAAYSDQTSFYVYPPATGTNRGYFYILNHDIMNQIIPPTPKDPSVATPTKSKVGARILNQGSTDPNSSDMRSFSLDTDAKPMIIHMMGQAIASSGSVVITHNLGYRPSYMLFTATATPNTLQEVENVMRANGNTISIFGAHAAIPDGQVFYYIILKDPTLF